MVESDGAVNDFEWYEQPANTLVNNGVIYATGSLQTTTVLDVFAIDIYDCASAAFPVVLNVVVEDSLVAPVLKCAEQGLQNGESKVEWDPVLGAGEYEVSIDNGATWKSPSSGVNGVSHTETGISDDNNITFFVRAINNAYICENTISSVSQQTCEVKLDITPINNSFSPNGDGVNDAWVISKALDNYPVNSVEIFNRWGDKVWETKNYDNITNNFTGEGLDAGTYFYVIKVPELGLEKSGYVMIVQ